MGLGQLRRYKNFLDLLGFIFQYLLNLFDFTWYISMTFSRVVWMVGNLLFFIYWFLDGVRSIKEVQKLSRPSWIYISIFTELIWFIYSFFYFLFFSIFIAIYVTNPITDVYKVNNGRHYQSQSNFWAHMGIMRWRSIFEDIDRLPTLWFTTQLTYINNN